MPKSYLSLQSHLTPQERVSMYRARAKDSMDLAETAPLGEAAQGYRKLAEAWDQLADDLEATVARRDK